MWVLECDGDILKNKRLWLRPGKKYLFGRTAKSDGGGFAIENKSISRKHLTIELAPVKAGDGSKLHTKSQLMISDLKSKFGTQLDGEQMRGESRILSSDEHEIKLGSYKHSIKWVPVVFSFSFSTKEQKNRDPLASIHARLEPLDIKAVLPYIIEKTTHVVATKRNTAKGLQALINARYIVTDTFIDTLVLAATPELPDDPESLSPLEADFDGSWPDALSHLPAQSKEPSQRSSQCFAPDARRANVFEGYTFVFCDNVQYENLHPPIANGGGKALLFELCMGETTAEEVVRYVKSAAGDKGTGKLDNQGREKGVVVVRFRGKKGWEAWSIEIGNEVARKLDQRLIEQSEFLDAILINDPSVLCKTLPEEEEEEEEGDDDGFDRPSESLAPAGNESPKACDRDTSQSTHRHPQISQLPNKRTRSRLVTSRFKGFDDGFDPASLPQSSKVLEESKKGELFESHECVNEESRLGELGLGADSQLFDAPGMHKIINRKRTSPPSEDEDHDEVISKMLPAAAAMKKRRVEAREGGRLHAETEGNESEKKELSISKESRGRKPRKGVDVLEAAREHREAEEDVARRDQEALRATIDGMEIDQMKSLAIVEEMEVIRRSGRHPRAKAYGDTGSRWDERWNGRKNFKRFRRREVGDSGQVKRGGTVIVGLEEVRKKDFGIGDGYWLEGNTRKGKQNEPQGFSGPESPPVAAARSRPSKDSQRPKSSQAAEQPRTTRRTGKTSADRQVGSVDGTKLQIPSRKRPPSPTALKPGPSKKRNGLFVTQSDSDDSEDDLKFRFRKKR
ncbi:hypothetical protein GP486_001234 [Trichoglossum hirsutum]|uniref:FHA domain-containing protein n=1 Tax=Trichoglossum hirsutum TaxID=265104 RepID=A0A9P8LHI6_9PEZI|nr:hypothetical protein GP486_001234 [Trichoglossum hirsutum]